MRRSAQPTFNFFTRIDPETDALRRRLQELLDVSGPELVSQAFRALEESLNGDRLNGDRKRRPPIKRREADTATAA
jgi:hypothetical protein